MVRLADHIDPKLVFADLEVQDVPTLFRAVGDKVGEIAPEVDVAQLVARLMERESSSSTGLGGGLALPHATADGLPHTLCVIVRPLAPLSMGDPETEPARLVFFLLSPPEGMGLHVRLLARLARLCVTPGFIDRMLESPDSESLRWTVVEEDSRHV